MHFSPALVSMGVFPFCHNAPYTHFTRSQWLEKEMNGKAYIVICAAHFPRLISKIWGFYFFLSWFLFPWQIVTHIEPQNTDCSPLPRRFNFGISLCSLFVRWVISLCSLTVKLLKFSGFPRCSIYKFLPVRSRFD